MKNSKIKENQTGKKKNIKLTGQINDSVDTVLTLNRMVNYHV